MPAHNDYFPLREGNQIMWLKNWRQKIANYQSAGGYQLAEISTTIADADYAIQLIETWNPYVQNFAQGATAHVKLILYGPIPPVGTTVTLPVFTGNPPSVLPPPPNSIPWPAAVQPAALKRIFAFVKNMKTRAFCTEAVMQDLQVIGAEQGAVDEENAKPDIKAKRRGDEVRIIWTKGAFDGVEIWVDRGTGTFVKLAVDMTPDYFDTEPLPATAQTWKYKARYILSDAPVGLFSDVVEFLAKA